jgi:type I restriction enzyme M protein
MAKSTKEVKEKAIEVTLWEAANKLRGSVEPAEYKHVVLGLIFLKFASDKFEDHRAKLMAEGKEKYIEMPDFYNMNNVFFLEEISRWSYLIKKSKQNDIALLIDTALHTIEKNEYSGQTEPLNPGQTEPVIPGQSEPLIPVKLSHLRV